MLFRSATCYSSGETDDYYCLLYNNHLDLTFLQAAPIGALIGVVYGLLQTVRLLMER